MGEEELISKLRGVRKCGAHSYMACCPAHDDSSPSLKVTFSNDGRVLIHCFGGCSVFEVCEAIGVEVSDLFPDTDRHHYSRIAVREQFNDQSPSWATKDIPLSQYIVAVAKGKMKRGERLTDKEKSLYAKALREVNHGA